MKMLSGIVSDKFGMCLSDCEVALMDDDFNVLYETRTNNCGQYELFIEERNYSFLYIVKEYGVNYLEFWFQNIDMNKDRQIDAVIDKIEIYGLHCFFIKGPMRAFTVYFRPMSLIGYLRGDEDIAPDLCVGNVSVTINGSESKVLNLNKVDEYDGGLGHLRGYLMQVGFVADQARYAENYL